MRRLPAKPASQDATGPTGTTDRSDPVQVIRCGRVATVTLHGTGTGNALGGAAFRQLPQVFRELGQDPSIHAVVLRGAGHTFSVGLDLRWYLPVYRRVIRNGDERAARQALASQTAELQDAVGSIGACPLPVIAAISGECTGAALELAITCDIRLCSAEAIFTAAEAEIGVVADLGLLQRLPRLASESLTAYMAFTGDPVQASQAQRDGLVRAVHPDPQALYRAAAVLAARISRHDRHVLGGIKQVMHASRDLPVGQGLAFSALWTAAFLPGPDLFERLRERLTGPDGNPVRNNLEGSHT